MDPRDRAGGGIRQLVRETREVRGIARFDEVPLADVAVAEVHADFDVGRHTVDRVGRPRHQPLPHVARPPRRRPAGVGVRLDDGELDGAVPLDREVVVRHGREHTVELAIDQVAIHRLDRLPVLPREERADHRRRRRQRHLEARPGGDHAL
ncbi:hypothetical protein, partial [Microbacterium lacticum]|uniref:hypothetical protein n=1 Tax=Microbacterium lacticum TaxID=33885 RepID=UPI001F583951